MRHGGRRGVQARKANDCGKERGEGQPSASAGEGVRVSTGFPSQNEEFSLAGAVCGALFSLEYNDELSCHIPYRGLIALHMKNSAMRDSNPLTRRRWIKQFMLGSAVAAGVSNGWRGTLLASISPNAPSTDIIPISLSQTFPGLLDGSTPSIQIRLSIFDEVIMINRAPYSDLPIIYVLDSRCTHQGCLVSRWQPGYDIVCPCHGSIYDIDGSLIHGAAGPSQPPLLSYNSSYDGVDLLRIHVPGLNLKINDFAVQTNTPANKRLRLSFFGRPGCDYRVSLAPDLENPGTPILFATSASGAADQSAVRAVTADPMNVWVDETGTQGFYRIELILNEYY